jgi:uncharacterized protein (DUF1697 family)
VPAPGVPSGYRDRVTRYALLLRGINVGGNKKIPMADLRALLGRLGYGDVATLLQSGNAVLSTAQRPATLISTVEAALTDEFGMQVRCLVRTAAELTAIAAAAPLAEDATDGSKRLVMFLSEAPDPKRIGELDPDDYAPELFRVDGREIHMWFPDGMRDAKLAKIDWNRRFGLVASGRNWNTVVKLTAMVTGS